MRRGRYLGLAVLALAGISFAAAAKEDSMAGYYGNTLVAYNPGVFERHSWYNSDGTSVLFSAAYAPEGLITLSIREQQWQYFDGYVPRILPRGYDTKGMNAYSNIGLMLYAHVPGQHWRELVPEGPDQDLHEQFTIVPGHQ
jgi:hypothetical protein